MTREAHLGLLQPLRTQLPRAAAARYMQPQTQFAARLLAVDMLLHAFSNEHISKPDVLNALGASCHDKRSTLGAVAALAHATAKGCSSRLLQPRTQFAARLLAVDMLLHAFSNDHIYSLMFDALGASCHGQEKHTWGCCSPCARNCQGLQQPATAAVDAVCSQAAGC